MKFVSPLVRNIRRFSIMINVRQHTIPYHQNNRVMLLCRVFRPTAFHKIFLPQSHWPKTNCFRHINTVHIAICVSPERAPGIGCYIARSHIIIEIANTHGFAGKHVQPQTRSTNLFLNNKRCTQISGSHLPIAYGAFVPNAYTHMGYLPREWPAAYSILRWWLQLVPFRWQLRNNTTNANDDQ